MGDSTANHSLEQRSALATSSGERLDGSHLAEIVDRYIVLALNPLKPECDCGVSGMRWPRAR